MSQMLRKTSTGKVLASRKNKAKEKVQRPGPTETDVNQLSEGYATEAQAVRDTAEYKELFAAVEKARKQVESTKKKEPRSDPSLTQLWQQTLTEHEKELQEAERKIGPLQTKITEFEKHGKQIEAYLKDPKAPIDPEVKRGVDMRGEKASAVKVLKKRIDRDLEDAKEDEEYKKLRDELDDQIATLKEYEEEENSKQKLKNDDMFQQTKRDVEKKRDELALKIRPMQGKIDALQQQSNALARHAEKGETTGLPDELQGSVDELADTALSFRDAQNQIENDIAAKQKEIDKILQEPEVAKIYKELQNYKKTLKGLESDINTQSSRDAEQLRGFVKDYTKRMEKFADRLGPLEKEQEKLREQSEMINDRLARSKFGLDDTDELAAQVQYRVDKAKVESLGLDFKEKAAEVLIREPAVKRAENKNKDAQEKQATAKNQLDEAIRNTPALKSANEKAVAAQKDVEEKTKKQTEAAEKLAEKSKEYEKLYREMQEGSPEDQFAKLDRLNALSNEMADAKQGLRDADSDLTKASSAATDAQTKLDQAVAEQAKTSGGELAKAHQAFTEAQGETSNAAKELERAQQKLEEAKAAAKVAQNRKKVAELLPDARKDMESMLGEFEEIKDIKVWEQGGPEAVQKKLGDRFPEFQNKVKQQFTSKYQVLKESGATMEELQALYKGVPYDWLPPQFRKEEQNWLKMKDFINAENVEKLAGEESKKVDKFISVTSAGSTIGSLVSTAGTALSTDIGQEISKKAFGKELSKEQGEAVSKFAGLAGAICGVMSAAATLGKAGTELGESETADPIEMMMLQDELLDAMNEMAKSGLELTGEAIKILWKELPALGVISDSMDVMKFMKEMAERIANAQEDRRLFEEAQQQEHQGEKSFKQFANRDKHLAARAGSDMAISALSAASGVVTMTGVGGHAGVALKGVSTGVKVVKFVAETVVDKNAAQKAKELLEKAQAGNPIAREELFAHHGRYAKGLISLMAIEGDSLALACLKNHGLSEDMIAKSSAPIIKKYLMKRFKETDDPASWSDTWKSIKEGCGKVVSGMNKAADFVLNIYDSVVIALGAGTAMAVQSELFKVAYNLQGMNAVAEAVGTYQSVRFRRDGLAATSDGSTAQNEELTKLDQPLAEARKKLEEVRAKINESNTALAKVSVKVQSLLIDNRDDKDLQKAKDFTTRILRHNMQALDVVVTAL